FRDREIVDRGEPKSHETVRIELPVFISIRAKPMTGIVMPLISKPYSDTIPGKRPEFLDEPVIQFFGPFPLQKLNDLLSSIRKFSAISPARIDCIRQRYFFRIASVPAIFCQAHFLNGSLTSKRRQRRTSCCRLGCHDCSSGPTYGSNIFSKLASLFASLPEPNAG